MVGNAREHYPFAPDYTVSPGEILAETIDALGMTQRELAVRTGLSAKTINLIIKGQEPITYETAIKLERATGTAASLWNNLERNYREQLAEIHDHQNLAADIAWLKTIPVKELVRRKVITFTKDTATLLQEVLEFFGVSSTRAWHDLWLNPKVAARKSHCFESHPGPTATWLRLGESEARDVKCRPFDRAKFVRAIRRIRTLTQEGPDKFVSEMQRLCAEAGIAVVLVPEIKGAPWHGASWWFTPRKAVIELSLRGKWEDQFWFSFFHEAGHILNDSKKEIFINDGKEDDPREARANEFASDLLIPRDLAGRIPFLRSHDQVKALASTLGIAPGIVVGRFQRETGKWGYFNGIRRRLVWETED